MYENEESPAILDADFLRLFGDAVESFESMRLAKTTRDRERDKCDRDWGYFGYDEERRLSDATDKLALDLQKMIDNRINAYFERQNKENEHNERND